MYMAARERKIIESLLERLEEVPIKALSDEIDVSLRTIHRDLKGVERILRQYGLTLQKKAGSGIKLLGDPIQKEALKSALHTTPSYEYTSDERQTIVLTTLLEVHEPVKLISLANDLNVTIATISNDLDKIEQQLESYGLALLRKRGYGVEIVGSETAKRRAISTLIGHHLDEFELMHFVKANLKTRPSMALNIVNARLLGLINQETIHQIEEVIYEMKQDLPFTIADRAYIGLVVHLALAIDRMKQGENILFDEHALAKFVPTKEYSIAKEIVRRLEEKLEMAISTGEVGYITMHLLGTKLIQNQEDFLDDPDLNLRVTIQRLIEEVGLQIQCDLTGNNSLQHGLMTHLRPAVYRIKHNMGIANPLLSKIQQDYPELFEVVSAVVEQIFPDIHFPDEEIGYIVIHFASELVPQFDRLYYRVLVICSSGIGTSKILATRLEYEIPGVQTINVSMFDWADVPETNYDLILSTIPLKNTDKAYVFVSPLLSQDEVEKVKQALRAVPKPKPTLLVEQPSSTIGDEMETLRRTMEYAAAIHQLASRFEIVAYEGELDKAAVLSDVCRRLKEIGLVNHIPALMESLADREKLGGFGIPGSGVALFHTWTNAVNDISFTVTRLASPIKVAGMDGSTVNMSSMLMMLSPKSASPSEMQVLSAISGLLVRDAKTIHRFEHASEDELLKTILVELKQQFLNNSL